MMITKSQKIPGIYKSSEFMNRPFIVGQQCQTSIVPEIPPDNGEDNQQYL